jgi:undecaprenyl-diphosphatase
MEFIQSADFKILQFISENVRNGVLDVLAPAVTRLGDGGIVWILLAGFLSYVTETRRAGIVVFISMAVNVIICNLVLKPLIARPRPFDVMELTILIRRPDDFSFPSGHTSASFAAATAVFFYYRQLGAPRLVLAVLISLSRLYLLVHFPSDIIAGVLLGIISAFLGECFYNFIVYGKV